jgi:Zn-dependent protease/predicted transcriptional regulator
MKPSFRLRRIAGVDVGVHWSVLFIVAIVTWSLGAQLLPDTAPGYAGWEYWIAASIAALAFAGSILAHELSHAVVANRDGVPVESIVLWLFGGVAKLRSHARTARSELRIALAGPAMSLLIGAVSLGLAAASYAAGVSDLVTASLSWLGGINVVLAVFNLLPGAPLDGGRVLTALLWKRTGDERRARLRSANAGRILGQTLIGLGIVQFAFVGAGGLWTALIGWLIVSMARMEMVESDLERVFAGVRVRDVMTTDVVTLRGRMTVDEFVNGPWMRRHVSTVPVVDTDGRPLGIVSLKLVGGLAPDRWSSTQLSAIAVPISDLVIADPGDALIEVLSSKTDANARVLVMSGDRLVGIVSPTDVANAFERLSLVRSRSPATLGPPPPTSDRTVDRSNRDATSFRAH